jgi:hypothetical protein
MVFLEQTAAVDDRIVFANASCTLRIIWRSDADIGVGRGQRITSGSGRGTGWLDRALRAADGV